MNSNHSRGLISGLAAFAAWGIVPLYWRQISQVPALQILAHRAIWSLVFTGILLTIFGQWRETNQNSRAWAITLLRGILVSANWLIFIWAVNAGHIIETSMGYFINPLVSLLFGVLFFQEKLRPRQWIAVALAVSGVVVAGLDTARGFPWIAVGLALTFACYGTLKKITRMGPLPGLFLETACMVPIALAYLWLLPNPVELRPVFSRTPLLLIGGGVITVLPLLWFADAAQKLRLSTIGFLQFVAPSLTFSIGVLVYHEPFSGNRLVAFAFIWAGVILFTSDALARTRDNKKATFPPVALE